MFFITEFLLLFNGERYGCNSHNKYLLLLNFEEMIVFMDLKCAFNWNYKCYNVLCGID
jgi:hypothetical protein